MLDLPQPTLAANVPMSIEIDVAPPEMPLPTTNRPTATRMGQRLPKTKADCPKNGMRTVLWVGKIR